MLARRQIGHCFLAIMAGKPDAPTRQDYLTSATDRKFKPIYLQQSEP